MKISPNEKMKFFIPEKFLNAIENDTEIISIEEIAEERDIKIIVTFSDNETQTIHGIYNISMYIRDRYKDQ